MTRKDFELIAATLRAALSVSEDADHFGNVRAAQTRSIARALAASLATTNPAFNRARFLKACGIEEA